MRPMIVQCLVPFGTNTIIFRSRIQYETHNESHYATKVGVIKLEKSSILAADLVKLVTPAAAGQKYEFSTGTVA